MPASAEGAAIPTYCQDTMFRVLRRNDVADGEVMRDFGRRVYDELLRHAALPSSEREGQLRLLRESEFSTVD